MNSPSDLPAPLSRAVQRRLETAARRAAAFSYSPYSQFRVGAAVLTESGRIFAGCNVENASYGLCNCAERTAIFTAAAAGERRLRAVAVYTPTAAPTLPCGACRQVMHEFGPAALVICLCDSPARREEALSALLPGAFGPEDLLNTPDPAPPATPRAGRPPRGRH
jgi:cytidine deaminase